MELLKFLDDCGVDYKQAGDDRHISHGWVGLSCPLCDPHKEKYHLGMHLEHGFFNCWRCGPLARVEILRQLTGKPYAVCREAAQAPYRRQPLTPRPGPLQLPSGLQALQRAHRGYLARRGIDPDQAARLWRLQATSELGSLPWRIVIPICQNGACVSWTARSITQDPQRYLSARADQEVVPAKSLLFGADYVRHAALCVEGPFDAMRIGPGAVATLGTAVSQTQLARLAAYPVRILCFDHEPQAQARARRLCDTLSLLPGKTINVQLDAHDPGSASAREIQHLRKSYLDDL